LATEHGPVEIASWVGYAEVVTFAGFIRRLPIRLRVGLTLGVVVALVLLGSGVFLDLRFSAVTQSTVDDGLRSRAGDVTALVRQADAGLRTSDPSELSRTSGGFAQVLDGRGAIFDATPQLVRVPVLSPRELRLARRSPRFFSRSVVAGVKGPVRLLAVPVDAQDKALVVVVGTGLTERNLALRSLRVLLLLSGGGALLLVSLAGYLAVAAALRPVESMRRRAQEINEANPGLRLPVVPADDEIGRLGATLNVMLEHLEQALIRERTFVSDASHELRTPISILKAEFELALSGPQDLGTLQRALRSAAEEADRLGELAEDLLLISRGGHGQLGLDHAPTLVRQLFGCVRARYVHRTSNVEREIRIVGSDGLQVRADRAALERALANLVDNALAYGQAPITLRAVVERDTIELHVEDAGRGFPADFLAHAFDRFSRAEGGRTTPGSGLGLAIVAAVADAHGGTAHAANRPPAGGDVWITLPRFDRTPPDGDA